MSELSGAADSPQLTIGLIVDSPHVSIYVHALAQWAATQPNLAISHLIVQQLPPSRGSRITRALRLMKTRGLGYVLGVIGFAMIHRIEAFKLARMGLHREHFSRVDAQSLVPQVIEAMPERSASGLVYRYTADDVARIKALGLDVLVRCGSGILRGDILHAARFGILSFHHADNRINRGIPAGFWEVFERQDSTGFTLQQLTEELDGGKVLMRGHFATKFFYLYNQAELYKKSNGYLMQLLAELARTRRLPEVLPSVPYSNPLYRRPSLAVQARYMAYLAAVSCRNQFNRLVLRKADRWGVAFCHSDWRSLVMWRGQCIKSRPNHFLADPFVVSHEGKDYCFVEDYDSACGKGVIAAYALSPEGATSLGEVLTEPFHLSFPYIFSYQGRHYMCPETSRNSDIRLYEAVSFPTQWKLARIIMTDVSAADSMIFEHEGRWWMLTNTDSFRVGDHCAELSIFYTDDPIHGTWVPHAKNPIMVDSRKARNGGLLRDAQGIYRVSQRQGFETYGKASAIQRIVTLTPERYEEETVCAIEPRFFQGIRGTHHLHSNGRFTAFDMLENVN